MRKGARLGTETPAHYRLWQHTKHDVGCPLDPTAIIEHIAHGSHGLATVDEQGILRLNLPEKLTDIPPLDSDGDAVPGDVVTNTTTTVNPLLPPAVNSAVQIARFLQPHDFDDDIVKRFKVQTHQGGLIGWPQFCYGPARTAYATLYTRRRAHEVLSHPVAVFGTIVHIRQDKQERPYAVLAVNVPAGDEVFHVTLRSMYPPLIEPLSVGMHVLAVGAWDHFAGSFTPALRMFAEEHWQIAYWTTDETTGAVSDPGCPRPLTAQGRAHLHNKGQRGLPPSGGTALSKGNEVPQQPAPDTAKPDSSAAGTRPAMPAAPGATPGKIPASEPTTSPGHPTPDAGADAPSQKPDVGPAPQPAPPMPTEASADDARQPAHERTEALQPGSGPAHPEAFPRPIPPCRRTLHSPRARHRPSGVQHFGGGWTASDGREVMIASRWRLSPPRLESNCIGRLGQQPTAPAPLTGPLFDRPSYSAFYGRGGPRTGGVAGWSCSPTIPVPSSNAGSWRACALSSTTRPTPDNTHCAARAAIRCQPGAEMVVFASPRRSMQMEGFYRAAWCQCPKLSARMFGVVCTSRGCADHSHVPGKPGAAENKGTIRDGHSFNPEHPLLVRM
ncbi:hypothetical protein ACFYOD_38180 [Streptomyces sp. NPDC006703]|uniref:hypothetical protein n=1 Tax=Streptomyces sp. NPDC006703 TaxID=3364759 RepID=UPI00369D25A8